MHIWGQELNQEPQARLLITLSRVGHGRPTTVKLGVPPCTVVYLRTNPTWVVLSLHITSSSRTRSEQWNLD